MLDVALFPVLQRKLKSYIFQTRKISKSVQIHIFLLGCITRGIQFQSKPRFYQTMNVDRGRNKRQSNEAAAAAAATRCTHKLPPSSD